MDSISFDRIADRYDETRGGMERARNIAAGLEPRLAPGSVLEVGVGTGAISAALGEVGRHAVGIDLSEPMLRQALARFGARVAVGDAQRLPVRTASCANVLLVWVLHLVGDPVMVLIDSRRVLADGGRVLAAQRPPHAANDDVGAITDAMSASLRRGRPDTSQLTEHAAAAGLTLLERAMTTARTFEESPAEAIAKIEQRTFSSLWDVDNLTWTDLVEPGLDELRALPEPEKPRCRSVSQEVLVFVAAP